jgi:hypothetical protein
MHLGASQTVYPALGLDFKHRRRTKLKKCRYPEDEISVLYFIRDVNVHYCCPEWVSNNVLGGFEGGVRSI